MEFDGVAVWSRDSGETGGWSAFVSAGTKANRQINPASTMDCRDRSIELAIEFLPQIAKVRRQCMLVRGIRLNKLALSVRGLDSAGRSEKLLPSSQWGGSPLYPTVAIRRVRERLS